MNPSIQFKTITLPFLIAFALACFGPLPLAQALAPPPDGGYPGGNTAEGTGALNSFTPQARGVGNGNTALGYRTLYSDLTGGHNTATGFQALYSNTVGNDNTAVGYQAAFNNIGVSTGDLGEFNTAVGSLALYSNHQGGRNTAIGYRALYSDTGGLIPGQSNTAIGSGALANNTFGSHNIAFGDFAGGNLTTGWNNIDIGNDGVAAEANTIRIGDQENQTATYIAGIAFQTAPGGLAVYVNPDGKLGTLLSSARFKDAVKPMDKASEAIHALKPVTFRYKQELDPEGIPQFGLVAEEVEKVNPDLVARDRDGKPYTVRYEAVNAMLLNEFLKEHGKVQEQEAMIVQLRSTVAKQEATIAQQQIGLEIVRARLEEQAMQIQKVSAQLQLSKTAPQMVGNNQ